MNSLFKKNIGFIAEISANHNGSLDKAKKLILAAKKYGADAVKLQSYTPDTITLKSSNPEFQIKSGLWKGQTLWDLYKKAQTPFKWHKELFEYAKKINIVCFSSPFDESAVDLLESLNCPFYKIASFELNHIPLIKKVALTNKPMIISTGMANIDEIDLAYKTAKKFGRGDIILLYCVSNYPSKPKDFNLNNIKILKKKFGCKVGFSDHSTDSEIAAAAVVAGAQIFEKHIALKNQKKGFDLAFSLKGIEIKKYIETINKTSEMIGKSYFFRSKSEYKNKIYRRSIYAINDIARGEKFSEKNIRVVRPSLGMEPKYYEKILNKVSPKNFKKGKPISKNLIKSLKIK
jgi:pseudaminic acid synthase